MRARRETAGPSPISNNPERFFGHLPGRQVAGVAASDRTSTVAFCIERRRENPEHPQPFGRHFGNL
jgi:hypothetical protein